jgi:hypothetical protein
MQHRGRAALQRRVKFQNPTGLQPQDFARVGRTLLSDAFDVDVVVASDFDREGHGLSRAEKDPTQINRASAAQGRPTNWN